MLIRTHIAITVFFILFFLPVINHDIIFFVVALIATFLPDVDSRYSTLGRKWWNRILQFFTKHRGIIHSFTFLMIITGLFSLFIPKIAFGFFLGYGLHLLCDSFTKDGIMPFWPSKRRSSGPLKTGGRAETVILIIVLAADVILGITRIIL